MKKIIASLFILWGISFAGGTVEKSVIQSVSEKLIAQHGKTCQARIEKGVAQVAQFWQKEDGDDAVFAKFCMENFITNPEELDLTLQRYETNLETLYGHSLEIYRDFSKPIQLDIGRLLPVDYLFAEYDPYAHIAEDLFKTKNAFIVLLNHPIYNLEEILEKNSTWTRKDWAWARLTANFSDRVPAEISQNLTKAYVKADDYISNYNIFMHNLAADDDQKLFPENLRLISHWGLRDELKSQYANADGLVRQKMIQQVMERIIRQEIPQAVINSGEYQWDPFSNTLYSDQKPVEKPSEPDTRYQMLLDIFQAEKNSDPYYPTFPTKMDRKFQRDREIPEQKFESLLVTMLKDPVAKKVAKLISKRLDRDLLPFDIWYNGFEQRSGVNQSELDKLVGEKYPNVAAFQNDLTNILIKLGFDEKTAQFLKTKIVVDPSRGAGHAMGAERRADQAHLRTRIAKTGMTYKGFNIAIHELGHNVEQVFSLNLIDHYMLHGVPNTAFTEAFAFVFQSRDMLVLGKNTDNEEAEYLKALDTYWSTCEIAAVGLVDIKVWHWLYDHPDASKADLKNAVMDIAKNVWNEYYAPIFGINDVILLGIYSHMIDAGLYLPDYSLGHIIMFQIEQYLKDKNLGQEMERMCKIGSITPDAWMQQAVGSPISVDPLITATKKAVQVLD